MTIPVWCANNCTGISASPGYMLIGVPKHMHHTCWYCGAEILTYYMSYTCTACNCEGSFTAGFTGVGPSFDPDFATNSPSPA